MGAIMRAFDWSSTPLGPVENWSPTLRMMTRFLLANRFPLLLWWGPQFCQLYNDAYRPVLGGKHPQFVGQPVRECWSEIWHIIGPLIQTPFEGGPATWMEDISLEVNRYGFTEETHFTIAYSPVPDEEAPRGIGGVLATVHEISEKVVGERRIGLLRDIASSAGETRNAEEACTRVATILENHPKDIPFALLYLFDSNSGLARLAGTAGIKSGTRISPEVVQINGERPRPWPFWKVLQTEQLEFVGNLSEFADLPRGPWSDPPNSSAVLPIQSNTAHKLAGVMVAGLSPRLRFDDSYRGFLELASSQVATIVANARAYEEERKRAEALAELDRAKTIFFSNVSHEFRTPLTLIMTPLEEAVHDPALPAEVRERLELAQRNSVRLQKLVDNLLEFSRIEAGKAQAVFESVDLARLTGELASGFQSTFDKAGLTLTVSVSPTDPVYVDRDMWEKIVLNLLSNAFKFTFAGSVTIDLHQTEGFVYLTVADTGTGIPAAELPHIFERFHRIEGARGRSYEGTGIGLALVKELTRLHGGTIEVRSEQGVGTRFTIRIPTGTAHLTPEQIGRTREVSATAMRLNAFVSEALSWIPRCDGREAGDASSVIELKASPASLAARKRVLVADDNADMRQYVTRLLKEQFEVEAVANGKEAMTSIRRQRPDLLVSDVMMPGVDGLALLTAIRANPESASLPVILLSARAGEESEIEGLHAGADDYLVKPFSARELIARAASVLKIADVRAASEQALRAERTRLADLFQQAPAFFAVLRGPEHVFEMTNPLYHDLIGHRDVIGKSVREAVPEAEAQGFFALLDRVYQTGEPFIGHGRRMHLARAAGQPLDERYLDFIYQPMREPDGSISGIILLGVDVTDRKRAEQALIQAEKLAAVGRLASSIAHEINNPLESVTNLLYLMETALDEEVRLQYLAQAQAELARASKVATLTLRFHRQSTKARDTSLPEVLEGVQVLIEPRLKNAGIRVERQYGTRRQITAYEADLRQVFANLVTNAIDASERGGRLILRVRDAVNWKTGEPGIRVSIADTGVGMSEMTRRRIFDPFFTTKGMTGTGLGLWVTAGILQNHKATVRVCSSQNPKRRGTVFSIFFPLDAAHSADQHLLPPSFYL
jgi:PAS domain S-box-containing protein